MTSATTPVPSKPKAGRVAAAAERAPSPTPAATAPPFQQAIDAAAPRARDAVTAPASPPAAQPATIAATPGQIGQQMGVAIARHVAVGAGETMTVRLDPIEFGRIEVKLSFDDAGTLRAVVAADSPAALDMLRRDSGDLGRALADAGLRADSQSLRFDQRSGTGADTGGQSGQQPQRQPATAFRADGLPTDDTASPDDYRPLPTRGGIDLMA